MPFSDVVELFKGAKMGAEILLACKDVLIKANVNGSSIKVTVSRYSTQSIHSIEPGPHQPHLRLRDHLLNCRTPNPAFTSTPILTEVAWIASIPLCVSKLHAVMVPRAKISVSKLIFCASPPLHRWLQCYLFKRDWCVPANIPVLQVSSHFQCPWGVTTGSHCFMFALRWRIGI